jgi:nicotinate phosphoribosyltransferase
VDGDRFGGDVIALADEPGPPGAVALLEPAMRGGERVASSSLADARARAAGQRAALAPEHRRLDAEPYRVELSAALEGLRDALTARRRTG